MTSLRSRPRQARSTALVLLLAVALTVSSSLAKAQTLATPTPTATPTPVAGYAPCTLFTTFEVHDGEVFAKSTTNPNDKGQELPAGYAITFACGEMPTVVGPQAAGLGLIVGGTAGVLGATGIGLGVAAGTGAFGGGGPSTPPTPSTPMK